MSDTPKVIWAWESLVGDARIPENLWSIKSTPFSSLGDRATSYVLKDITDELAEALKQCEAEIDRYIQFEYPSDHPVHERYRQRDYAANPARIALAKYRTETET